MPRPLEKPSYGLRLGLSWVLFEAAGGRVENCNGPTSAACGADALRTFACGFDESTTSRVSTIRRPEPAKDGVALITRPKLLYGEQPATARRDSSVHRPLGIRFIAFRKAARFECLLQANLQKWPH